MMKEMNAFFESYFSKYHTVLSEFLTTQDHKDSLEKTVALLTSKKKMNATIYIIGNGGSAAIAEHMAVDFTKNAKLRTIAISGAAMLTALANDYGYEHAFEKAIESYANNNDLLIAISSSGSSKNILMACDKAQSIGMHIITFSGFDKNNPLRKKGAINFWVDSRAYGYIELIHNLVIHFLNDALIGSAEYPAD